MLQVLILAVAVLVGCRGPAGPSAEVVRKAAESLFEQAAHGEAIPEIAFTAQGPATPKLISSEIRSRRRIAQQGGDGFEYEVRLTYLNRIQQMEWGTVRIQFERKGDRWEMLPPPPKSEPTP